MKTALLFTDGAARGNPGPAGAGYILIDEEDNVLSEGSEYLGEATNNQAEYRALELGLTRAVEIHISKIDVMMDSELIVKQINGEYRVKNQGLKSLYKRVVELLENFDRKSVSHIRREKNKRADKLANRAIDEAI